MAGGWKRNSLDKPGVYNATLGAIKDVERRRGMNLLGTAHAKYPREISNGQIRKPFKEQRIELWAEVFILEHLLSNGLFDLEGVSEKRRRILNQRFMEMLRHGQKVFR